MALAYSLSLAIDEQRIDHFLNVVAVSSPIFDASTTFDGVCYWMDDQ